MALGEFRPPNQIDKDEDKYGKGQFSFTKIQILYAVLGLMLGFCILTILRLFHVGILTLLGVVIMLCLVCGGLFLGGYIIPEKQYLKGGGMRLDKYLLRMLKKRYFKKNQVLYTQNIDRDRVVYREAVAKKEISSGGFADFLKNIGNR